MSHSIGRWLLVAFWLSILVFGVSAEPTQSASFWGNLSSEQLIRTLLTSSAIMLGVSVTTSLLHRYLNRH
ncbi:MAG: hypothetical protein ACPG8W_06770 [Candidatus Promineifilaceae bacterium]